MSLPLMSSLQTAPLSSSTRVPAIFSKSFQVVVAILQSGWIAREDVVDGDGLEATDTVENEWGPNHDRFSGRACAPGVGPGFEA